MHEVILGIDVSKSTLHLALLRGEGKAKKYQVSNDTAGFAALRAWLQVQSVEQAEVCLEATNTYGEAVAQYLHEQGHRVSIVNPSRIKGFAQSELSRSKTDSSDAGLIARFCLRMHPHQWYPAPEAMRVLQQMSRRLEDLQQMIVQEKNRLETSLAALQPSIEKHITYLEEAIQATQTQINEHIQQDEQLNRALTLLVSIKGISQVSGSQILAEIGDWQKFRSARQLAAYAGLTPRANQSGTSLQGRSHLCKIGNSHLRRALYFPALTAIRWCEPIHDWAEQLKASGKAKMQVVGAVMHKLIRIVYGVLKSNEPFDSQKLVCQA
jgi:transposase